MRSSNSSILLVPGISGWHYISNNRKASSTTLPTALILTNNTSYHFFITVLYLFVVPMYNDTSVFLFCSHSVYMYHSPGFEQFPSISLRPGKWNRWHFIWKEDFTHSPFQRKLAFTFAVACSIYSVPHTKQYEQINLIFTCWQYIYKQ